MDTISSLRQIKKEQTRKALAQSAYVLFEQQGYSKTSIEDITRHANYAPRTFFLHFASKDELLFPDANMLRTSLQAALRNRSNGLSALQALKQWIITVVAYKASQDIEEIRLRKRIINSEPQLQGCEKLYLSTAESVIANEIAKDLGVGSNMIRPKIVAAAAIAVFTTIDVYVDQDVSKKETKAMIDMGIRFLEVGLTVV